MDACLIRARCVPRTLILQGDSDALNDLGWLLLNGVRLKLEPLLARCIFKVAKVLGSAEALFNLAEQAFYGKGIPLDLRWPVIITSRLPSMGLPAQR